ncbi:phage DNA packaging protein J [Candidatus Latescibacterota bacterium]
MLTVRAARSGRLRQLRGTKQARKGAEAFYEAVSLIQR